MREFAFACKVCGMSLAECGKKSSVIAKKAGRSLFAEKDPPQ